MENPMDGLTRILGSIVLGQYEQNMVNHLLGTVHTEQRVHVIGLVVLDSIEVSRFFTATTTKNHQNSLL